MTDRPVLMMMMGVIIAVMSVMISVLSVSVQHCQSRNDGVAAVVLRLVTGAAPLLRPLVGGPDGQREKRPEMRDNRIVDPDALLHIIHREQAEQQSVPVQLILHV